VILPIDKLPEKIYNYYRLKNRVNKSNSQSNHRGVYTVTYRPVAESAKILREALKKEFPEIKFSVRSKSYSMGSSIDITYTDGPIAKDVEKITSEFEDVRYDDMTGEILSGGNRFVHVSRDVSEENEKAIFNQIQKEYVNFDGWTLEDYHKGRMDWDVARIFRNKLDETPFYATSIKVTKKEEKPVETKQETAKIDDNSNQSVTVTVKHDRDWTWLTFSNKPSEETREVLKSNGARFSGKRIAWYFTKHVEQSELDSMLSSVKTETNNVTENNVEEKTEKDTIEKVAKNNNIEKADKLLKIADNMQKTIDDKLNPACGNQNYTARRARMAGSMMEDGYKLEKIQRVLYGLSDMWRSETISPLLENVTSKTTVETVFTYPNFMNCKRDSWMYELRTKLEKLGINYSNYDEIKSLLVSLSKGGVNREEEKRKRELENKAKSLIGQIPGFFPTPSNVAAEIVEKANIEPGNKVLEPSAGSGNLAEAIKNNCPAAEVDTIEYNYALCELLEVKGFKVIANDFMTYSNGKRFDRIVMNPPFENGQDMEHVKHAYELLGENGRLVSIMSTGAFFRNDRKAVEFREWFDNVNGYQEELPAGSFKDSLTGVSSCYVIIEK
jgi:phospholipid N-methyltransferase